MIVATFNGLDLLLVAAVIAICVGILAHGVLRLDAREREREARYWERRNRAASELEDVPEDWVRELDEIRRLPESAA